MKKHLYVPYSPKKLGCNFYKTSNIIGTSFIITGIILVFQEVLFQTKFMRTILAATENHCLDDDIEILCPSISRKNLQFLVQFLYKGSIPCSDNKIGNLSGDIDNKTVKIKKNLRTVKSRAVDRSTGQRSQYIRIKFPLHKESGNPWPCY